MTRAETHNYAQFAEAYADLEISGSFYLAYRDLPEIARKHAAGDRALDLGCGGGRSTRFLKRLGYDVVGADVEIDMVRQARERAEGESYVHLEGERLPFADASFDLALSCLVLLEVESKARMTRIMEEVQRTLKPGGVFIVVTGTREGYSGDWASFLCDFPENRDLKSGDRSKMVIRGTAITLYDYVWFDEDYREVFEAAGFHVEEALHPMPNGNEPCRWYSEAEKPVFVTYVLRKAG